MCPIDRYDVYLCYRIRCPGIQLRKFENFKIYWSLDSKFQKQQETIAESSMMCHDVPVDMLYILEAATHGARVTPAQTIYRRDIELDHSRNVKLDFPDEHLPKFR